VTVRLGGTPASFTVRKRVKPYQRPIRLYLVANHLAGQAHSRFDPRLSFIGQLTPDKNAQGVLTFRVPPLDTDDYAVAAWCPGCARYSAGRTFFTLPVGDDIVSRYRPLMLLHVVMSSATESCPVTIPKSSSSGRFTYGNGLLSTTLPTDGVVVAVRKEPDGSLFWKPGWEPHGFTGVLTVRGERLDASSPPMRVLAVRWGYSSDGRGSWATASTFPTEGCWRISGRVGDISLSYVVKVVGPS
jgi:hypothetical protein